MELLRSRQAAASGPRPQMASAALSQAVLEQAGAVVQPMHLVRVIPQRATQRVTYVSRQSVADGLNPQKRNDRARQEISSHDLVVVVVVVNPQRK